MRKPEFLSSDRGKLAQYRTRKNRRVNILIDDLEPQSKKMLPGDRDRFQTSVIGQLADIKRKAFRGDIALSMDLSTTSKNAPQAHTIAKNILDLLAERRKSVAGGERYVLYKDDSQIQALCVACRHGQNHPMIRIEGRPLSSLLADLELATEATRKLEMDDPAEHYRADQEREWLNTLKDLLQNENVWRTQLGDKLYEAYLKTCRWSAQRALLSKSSVDIPVLCWLYDRPKGFLSGLSSDHWADLICRSSVRLQVGELPITPGSAQGFQQRIAEEIEKFKAKWDWVIDPLVIAVALEVIIRPSPKTPAGVLHDLDNIVRDYILPKIVPSFDTVSDHTWRIDFKELRRTDPKLAERWGPNPTPPKGTRSGVTRYEIWRLPPAASGHDGFVSVALIADMDAKGGLIDEIDERISQWVNT